MWYAIVAILILIADQGLKYWVTVNIALDTGHVTLIPGVLELTNIHNNGAAFSMLKHAPHWIFILFTLVFAAIAVFCLRRNVVHGKVGRWSVVLVLAGAVGNCIDRILSGYVVDMFNFLFVRFAVFNLADVFIVVAGITLCLHVIFYRGDDGADDAAPKTAHRQRTGAVPDAPKARRLHLPAKRRPSAAPEASAKPAPNAAPAAAAPEVFVFSLVFVCCKFTIFEFWTDWIFVVTSACFGAALTNTPPVAITIESALQNTPFKIFFLITFPP